MKRLYFVIASLALLFAGCQGDDNFRMVEEVSSFDQITVTPDFLAETRAHIDDNMHVVWDHNDTIGVYSDIEGVVPFVYTSGNTFTAAKSVKGTKFYAYYPYSNYPISNDSVITEGNTLRLYLPYGNYYELDGTTDAYKKYIPMVGKSINNHFTFKQVMGMIHFTIKDLKKISTVTLESNYGESLRGWASIDMTEDSPLLKLDDPIGKNNIPFKMNKTLTDGEVADIYFPVPVGTYSEGFKVSINGLDKYGNNNTTIKKSEKKIVVSRASMKSYTEINFNDETLIDLALTNAYVSFYGDGNPGRNGAAYLNNYVFGDVAGGDANKGATVGDQRDFTAIESFSWTKTNSYIQDKWDAIYEAVKRAHIVMDLVSQVDLGEVPNLKQIIAQAKFIKSVWLFEGMRMFGAAIPYVSLEDYQANRDNPRLSNLDELSNYKYIWNQVEQDLKDAINDLPATWDAENQGRATSWMAKAMLAKLYLYWSSPYNGTNATANHWNDAKTILDDIINNGVNAQGEKYALANNYSDLFDINTKAGSEESVFDIQVQAGYYIGFSFEGGWMFYQPTHEFVNSFIVDANGLPVSDYTDYDPLSRDNSEDEITTDLHTAVDPRLDFCAGRMGIPYWNLGYPRRDWIRDLIYAGPYVHKKNYYRTNPSFFYAAVYQGAGRGVRLYHVIRYADILLMRAECAIEEGNLATALTLINKVRARAANDFVKSANEVDYEFNDMVNGLTKNGAAAHYKIGLYSSFSSASEARTALEREIRAEFGMEGHRWFDIVRWGKAATVLNNFRTFENKWSYGSINKYNTYSSDWVTFPIPDSAINYRIRQNINWW